MKESGSTDLSLKRRQTCKPWLIAILCGALSPFTSLVFAIRQRSLALALIPVATIFTANLLIYPPGFRQDHIIRLILQGICGLAVYFVTYRQRYEINDQTLSYPKNCLSDNADEESYEFNSFINYFSIAGIFILRDFVKSNLLNYNLYNVILVSVVCYSIFAVAIFWIDYYFLFSIKKISFKNILNFNKIKIEGPKNKNQTLKERLEELKDLYDQGLISEDEYKSSKAKSLNL
ncbi:SHOCT domain-containing protein [Prochlorococcus marinus]|uniref:SHOCT domain-containing protein n=1 Tax=Prochlorococcus marinus TaxID=1219 RepID=UPI0022B2EC7E|nr:SHOCT domain-containing protein [Prochlorococcus marinus]